jgi:hypothetical protein
MGNFFVFCSSNQGAKVSAASNYVTDFLPSFSLELGLLKKSLTQAEKMSIQAVIVLSRIWHRPKQKNRLRHFIDEKMSLPIWFFSVSAYSGHRQGLEIRLSRRQRYFINC